MITAFARPCSGPTASASSPRPSACASCPSPGGPIEPWPAGTSGAAWSPRWGGPDGRVSAARARRPLSALRADATPRAPALDYAQGVFEDRQDGAVLRTIRRPLAGYDAGQRQDPNFRVPQPDPPRPAR